MNTDKKLLAVLRKQNKVMDISVIVEKMDTIIEKLDDIASALAAPDVDPEPTRPGPVEKPETSTTEPTNTDDPNTGEPTGDNTEGGEQTETPPAEEPASQGEN